MNEESEKTLAVTTDALVPQLKLPAYGLTTLHRSLVRDGLQYSKSTYDTKGNLATTETCSAANVCTGKVRYAYDNQSRRVATIHVKPDLTELVLEQSGYTLGGRLHTKTDANGNVTEFGYTPTGRLAYVVQTLVTESGPESLLTEYTYDSRGNKLTQTDALERTTAWQYDQYGRLKKHTLPLGQYETYTYNADGTLAQRSDFNGDTTVYTYDPQYKRLTTVTYADTTTESYTYDPVSGRRLTATDDDGTTTYQYYPVTKRLMRTDEPGGSYTITTWNANGNKLTETTEHGLNTTWTYDALGRIQTANGKLHTYTHFGKPATVVDSDNNTRTYSYDDLGRLTYMTTTDASDTLIESFTYTLDANGNRITIEELDGTIYDYAYDGLNRLTQEAVTVNDETAITLYTMDKVGNRLTKSDPSGTITYVYDANDRLTTETMTDTQGVTVSTKNYTYDANGNQLSAGATINLWDKKNRLIGSDNGIVQTSYTYDTDNLRTSKTVNGITTNNLLCKTCRYARVIEEKDASGNLLAKYTYGNDLLGMERGGNTYGYVLDGHGSVRKLTKNGQITDTYDYDAYGNQTASTGTTENSFRYSGEQYDSETGNYYLRARYYDPGTGRFNRMDDWEGSMNSPITLNKYLYGNGNPVMGSDPSGRMTTIELTVTLAVVSTLALKAISIWRSWPMRGLLTEERDFLKEEFGNNLNIPHIKLAISFIDDCGFVLGNTIFMPVYVFKEGRFEKGIDLSFTNEKNKYEYKGWFAHEALHVWQQERGFLYPDAIPQQALLLAFGKENYDPYMFPSKITDPYEMLFYFRVIANTEAQGAIFRAHVQDGLPQYEYVGKYVKGEKIIIQR